MQSVNITPQSTQSTTIRQSNFELLRIFAMLMIVAHHFSVHSGFDFNSSDFLLINKLWIIFIQIGGKIGVDVFVLISGYFLITAKLPKKNKAIKLWLQIFSYSFLLFWIFTLTGLQPYSTRELIYHCFPIIFGKWWFASSYFILYLVAPYLNKMLNSLDKNSYKKMLLLFGILWCVVPTLTGWTVESNNLLWFIFLYSLAGYIRIYGVNIKASGFMCILLSFCVTIFTFLAVAACNYYSNRVPFLRDYTTWFYDMNSLFILLISALLFIGFSKLNIKANRIINVIASATFGVYLIHDNRYVRAILWSRIFHTTAYSNRLMLIPYSIFVICAIFVICTIIELVRIYVFEKHYMKMINTQGNKSLS